MESQTPLTQMQALVSRWSTLMVTTRPSKRGRDDEEDHGRAIRSRTEPGVHGASGRDLRPETQLVPAPSDTDTTQNNA